MGKLINGIHGPIQGKVGTVVGSSWKGIPYIKSRPSKRGSARGDDEKHNQDNFGILHRWLKPVIDILRPGFKGYAPRVEGFNAAKSYNLKHAFVGNEGNKVLDPSLIQISYGDLPLPAHISVSKVDNYTLQFNWDTATPEWNNRNDQTMLLAYDFLKNKFIWILTGEFRKTGTDTLTLHKEPGFTYHVYIAFTAHDRSRQSHSVYLGTVTT